MVDYGEDGVVSMAVRELCDQVHGYDFEWLGWRRDIDFIWRGNGPMCECFVLLALGASFDIVFDPFGYSGPPSDPFGGVNGPVSSHMCRRRFVVYQVQETPFEFVVWWEHHFAFVFPEAYGWFHS